MYRLGVTSEFHGEGRPGEGDVVLVVGTGGGGADSVSGSASASLGSGLSSGSLCSSAMSSLTDDGAESSPAAVADRTWSSSSPGEDTMQLERGGGGPLYELSPLLAHLPVRTGLSKYYKGKSQSFASLSDVECLQDLAKKSRTRHIGRIKASPSSILHHVHGACSKTIAKKTTPRSSSDQLLSRAGGRGLLLHRSGKPPACQSKKELWSTYA